MKIKLIVLFLLMSICAFPKNFFIPDEGIGEVGLTLKAGKNFYQPNYDAITVGADIFWDFAKFNQNIGVLAGWNCVLPRDLEIEGNDGFSSYTIGHQIKAGLRAYRVVAVGLVCGLPAGTNNTSKYGFGLGPFVGLYIPIGRYLAISGELNSCAYDFHVSNWGFNVLGGLSITIPTTK